MADTLFTVFWNTIHIYTASLKSRDSKCQFRAREEKTVFQCCVTDHRRLLSEELYIL